MTSPALGSYAYAADRPQVDVAVPTGTTSGELLVAAIATLWSDATSRNGSAFTADAGWTQVGYWYDTTLGAGEGAALFTKTAGTETNPYNFGGGDYGITAWVMRFPAGSSVGGFGGAGGTSGLSGVPVTFATAPAADYTSLVFGWQLQNTTALPTPSGWTQIHQATYDVQRVGIFSIAKAASSPTSGITFSSSGQYAFAGRAYVAAGGGTSNSQTVSVPVATTTLTAPSPAVAKFVPAVRTVPVPVATSTVAVLVPSVTAVSPATNSKSVNAPTLTMTAAGLLAGVVGLSDAVMAPNAMASILSVFQPAVIGTSSATIAPNNADINVSVAFPQVIGTSLAHIEVPTVALELALGEPSVLVSSGFERVIAVPTTSMLATALSPDIAATSDVTMFVPVSELVVVAHVPEVTNISPAVRRLETSIAAASVQAFAPEIVSSGAAFVTVDVPLISVSIELLGAYVVTSHPEVLDILFGQLYGSDLAFSGILGTDLVIGNVQTRNGNVIWNYR